jgi:hypothetical protein
LAAFQSLLRFEMLMSSASAMPTKSSTCSLGRVMARQTRCRGAFGGGPQLPHDRQGRGQSSVRNSCASPQLVHTAVCWRWKGRRTSSRACAMAGEAPAASSVLAMRSMLRQGCAHARMGLTSILHRPTYNSCVQNTHLID